MFHPQLIEDLNLPELSPYRTMRRPVEHEEQGIFVAEGEKVVRRLLESPLHVCSVLLPDKWLSDFEPLLLGRPEDLPVFIVRNKHLLEELVGFSMFQGVMAVGRIPRPPSLSELVSSQPAPRLFLAVDGLSNAENLGVLVRNAVAFGVQALIVGETCASPYLRRAVRNSMGTIFKLPVVESDNLVDALSELRRNHIRCVAAHPHASGRTIAQINLTGDTCLVVGSEGMGLSPSVLEACEEAAAIPMLLKVDSLNVSNAAAVFLYEVNRQRGKM